MADHKGITDALVAFQAELPDVSKGGTNPAFKSKYATLPDITKAVFPVASKHGLAFVTFPDETDHGPVLRYELRHTSGESITGSFGLPDGAKAQEYGSWITYFRRYILSAITGITPDEDDDGNAATTARSRAPRGKHPGVQRIESATTLDDLRAAWEGFDSSWRTVPEVQAAKNKRKQELETPGDAWGPVAEVPA